MKKSKYKYAICCGEMINIDTKETVGHFNNPDYAKVIDDYYLPDPYRADGLEIYDPYSKITEFTFSSYNALGNFMVDYDLKSLIEGNFITQCSSYVSNNNFPCELAEGKRNASKRRAVTIAKNSGTTRTNKARVRTRRGSNRKSRG